MATDGIIGKSGAWPKIFGWELEKVWKIFGLKLEKIMFQSTHDSKSSSNLDFQF